MEAVEEANIPFDSPDTPSKCLWKLGRSLEDSPHNHKQRKERPKIFNNILEAIGYVPTVRLDRIAKKYGIKCNLLAKCEYLNPGGSVKDRIGYRMIMEAHKAGKLKPGCTLIEPTSGNTGIGIAMASAVLGYRCIIVISEKMSDEKINTLKGLGAEIIKTRASADYLDEDSHVKIAQRLRNKIKDSVILDQYKNAYNPIAHYDDTAEDILGDCEGKIDALVLTAGTGGTIAGISRKIKEKLPECKIYGVDPVGSILAQPNELNDRPPGFYEVEGIGYDFIPTVLDRSCIDEWIKVDDKEALCAARELLMLEGMLAGGSSGTALYATIEVAKKMKEGETLLTLLPDSLRNYMTKFLSDSWMVERNFLLCSPVNDHVKGWWDKSIQELPLNKSSEFKCSDLLKDIFPVMCRERFSVYPVVNEDGMVVGCINANRIISKNVNKVNEIATVKDVMPETFKKVYLECSTLGYLYHVFDHVEDVIVLQSEKSAKYVGTASKIVFASLVN